MSIFGVELDEILKGRPDRGINFRDNDLFLEPTRMLPAPQTKGKLSNAFIRDDKSGPGVRKRRRRPRRARAGITSGSVARCIRFGRLTMSDTDLKLIDMDPRDPFDFYPAQYNEQLVAGYRRTHRTTRCGPTCLISTITVRRALSRR